LLCIAKRIKAKFQIINLHNAQTLSGLVETSTNN